MATPYDDWKANDREGDAWQAKSEAVSVSLSEMDGSPEWIEKALNEIDCDHTEELMALRVNAYLTDEYGPLIAYEKSRLAEYLLKFAKAEIEGARATRCAQTAEMFANRLSNDEE